MKLAVRIRQFSSGGLVGVVFALSMLGPSQVQAAGDAAAGQAFFGHCTVCHSTSAGVNKIGPSLAGIMGRKSGSVPGFNYSTGMKNSNVTWDESSLDRFLQNPDGFIHGAKMFYSVPNSADRQNVIAYLGTLKQ